MKEVIDGADTLTAGQQFHGRNLLIIQCVDSSHDRVATLAAILQHGSMDMASEARCATIWHESCARAGMKIRAEWILSSCQSAPVSFASKCLQFCVRINRMPLGGGSCCLGRPLMPEPYSVAMEDK